MGKKSIDPYFNNLRQIYFVNDNFDNLDNFFSLYFLLFNYLFYATQAGLDAIAAEAGVGQG